MAASDWAPQLPHELEHIIEALDGVDLRATAARSGRAWKVGHEGFESSRAQEAGIRIAGEYRRNAPELSARHGSPSNATP